MTVRTVTADRGDAGRRLDLVLRRHLTDLHAATRTRVQTWIESGHVTVNGAAVRRVSTRAALGDVVSLVLPPLDAPPTRPAMAAENVGLRVLFQDDHLLALDILEDVAGNQIGRAFEVDNFETVDKSPDPKSVSIPFTVQASSSN